MTELTVSDVSETVIVPPSTVTDALSDNTVPISPSASSKITVPNVTVKVPVKVLLPFKVKVPPWIFDIPPDPLPTIPEIVVFPLPPIIKSILPLLISPLIIND